MRRRPLLFPATSMAALAAFPAAVGAQVLLYELPGAGRVGIVDDLDGDGVRELQVDFDVYSGADGSFFFDASVPNPGGGYGSPTPIGDIDGDGYPDVAFLHPLTFPTVAPVAVYSGLTKAFLGDGEPAPPFLPGLDGMEWVDGSADVDGDGAVDLVFGTATFTSAADAAHGYLSGAGFSPGATNDTGDTFISSSAMSSALLGDLDGDGVTDAVFRGTNPWGDTIYSGEAFAGAGELFTYLTIDAITGLADVDGDGRTELLQHHNAFPPPLALQARSAADPSLVLLAVPGVSDLAAGAGDLDCDGQQDVLVTTASPPETRIVSGFDGGTLWQTPVVATRLSYLGDLDGDGAGDWAIGSDALGTTQVWAGPDTSVATHCTGKTTSGGCTPAIGSSGQPSALGPDDFVISARDALQSKPGLFFWGTSGAAALPFFGGTLCVQPPLQRGPLLFSTGPADCLSGYAFLFSQAVALQYGITPGTRVHGQFWTRDPAHPDGTGVGLSDGIAFTWCQ